MTGWPYSTALAAGESESSSILRCDASDTKHCRPGDSIAEVDEGVDEEEEEKDGGGASDATNLKTSMDLDTTSSLP